MGVAETDAIGSVGMKRRSIFPALAFFVPLTVYLLTMPRGLTWAHNGADGGDLITAAATLGVPHPSGYPTYVLLGWLFSKIPLGTLAWRFNLLSALATAGAAFWVYRIIAERTGNRRAGVIGAWAFALTPLVWGQAIITEVYGVNLFFMGLLLWLIEQLYGGRQNAVMSFPRKRESIDSGYFPVGNFGMTHFQIDGKRQRYAFLTGLLFGLAMGTHLTVIFWLPILGYFIIRHLQLAIRHSILGFLLGAAIFLYLPLRAGHGAITWGAPDTLGGFWALVSGQIYRGYLFSLPIDSLARRIPALARYFISPGIVPLALAVLGAWRLWRRDPRRMLAAGVSAGGYIVWALGYATADSFVYLLPVFLLMGIAVGLGLIQLLEDVSPRWHGLTIGAVMAILLLTAGVNWKIVDLRRDTAAETFWQSVLADTPPDAVLLTDTDRATFALWYARFALKKRPDVAVVDTRLAAFGWHWTDLRRHDPDLPQLAEMDTIFSAQQPYPRPLCRVLNSSESKWSIHCHR